MEDDEIIPDAELEDGEVQIEIDGDDPEDEAERQPLVKHLRGEIDKRNHEIRVRDRRLAELSGSTASVAADPGAPPTIEDCEWDQDRHTAKLTEWGAKRDAYTRHQAIQEQQQESQKREFQSIQSGYRAKAAGMGLPNLETAEASIVESLGSDYLGAIIKYADNAPAVIAALGAHPAKLAKIADITDPMLRLKALFQLEGKIVVNKKKPPAPETLVRGSASVAPVASDKQEADLLAKAQRSGNMDDYRAFMKRKRKAT